MGSEAPGGICRDMLYFFTTSDCRVATLRGGLRRPPARPLYWRRGRLRATFTRAAYAPMSAHTAPCFCVARLALTPGLSGIAAVW
eukprot:2987269-Pyramimonas_sp.AAC.1